MQDSGATDLASKGRAVLDATNSTKPKEEIEDVLQNMEKVRCPCGSSLQADSMIKVSFFFSYMPFYLFHSHYWFMYYDSIFILSVKIQNAKCGSILIVLLFRKSPWRVFYQHLHQSFTVKFVDLVVQIRK